MVKGHSYIMNHQQSEYRAMLLLDRSLRFCLSYWLMAHTKMTHLNVENLSKFAGKWVLPH